MNAPHGHAEQSCARLRSFGLEARVETVDFPTVPGAAFKARPWPHAKAEGG